MVKGLRVHRPLDLSLANKEPSSKSNSSFTIKGTSLDDFMSI